MDSSTVKIRKIGGLKPTEIELFVSRALVELENDNQDLKSDLKDLYINDVYEVGLSGNRKAVVIYYPFKFRHCFRKIQAKLLRELEVKYFTVNEDLFLIPSRNIYGTRRAWADVQDAAMRDVVRPAEIEARCLFFGKGEHYSYKFYLDSKEKNNTMKKLEAFMAVSSKIFQMEVEFEYMIPQP